MDDDKLKNKFDSCRSRYATIEKRAPFSYLCIFNSTNSDKEKTELDRFKDALPRGGRITPYKCTFDECPMIFWLEDE